MPIYLIIILTIILSWLTFITSFLLIYVIISGKRQTLINNEYLNNLMIHKEAIEEISGKLPLTINKQGIIE